MTNKLEIRSTEDADVVDTKLCGDIKYDGVYINMGEVTRELEAFMKKYRLNKIDVGWRGSFEMCEECVHGE